MPADSGSSRRARVVVTGLGVVSPIGVGVARFWEAALAGRVGTGPVTRFDTAGFQTHNAAEVRDFTLADYVEGFARLELALSTRFALAAARMCLEEAGLLGRLSGSTRAGVCLGTVMGSRPELEASLARADGATTAGGLEGRRRIAREPAELSRATARVFGLLGPNLTIVTACAAGNSAIGWAMDAIRHGRADVMVAGGAEQLSLGVFMMFNRMRALSPDVVRPFDRRRRGLLLGEGAAALVLERYDHALARGAAIYCKVAGHGNLSDAYHLTAPHPEGLGAARSMSAALRMGNLAPERVGHINAHGTGTPLNDVAEANAIRAVFAARASAIPVTALKSMVGHTQGAAGAMEAAATILAIRDGLVPPTANVSELDPECALDVVTSAPRRVEIDAALNNAFGFGGNNECVVFTRLDAG